MLKLPLSSVRKVAAVPTLVEQMPTHTPIQPPQQQQHAAAGQFQTNPTLSNSSIVSVYSSSTWTPVAPMVWSIWVYK